QRAKIPVVPGGTDPIETVEQAREFADRYGFPLALKASGGGGGKGLKIARSAEEIESALATARREAEAYFNNGTIYAERYLENPKHVELQILADRHGNAIHVGERDCSLQRRHQKLWEEAPAQISATLRGKMRAAAVQAAKAIGYDSVGTIECLVAGDRFYFLEMNTRIQVEHTVTEMISGLDLIREQIRVAAGEPLGIVQDDVRFDGFAIEGRVNAEDPSQDFRPAPGTVTKYREPGGLGVRVDSAAYPGITITPEYDSMIAKLIVWAPTRTHAIARFRRAIDEFVIEGVPTTLPLLRALCDHPLVIDGSYGTQTLETFAQTLRIPNNGGAGITTGDAVPVADTIAVEVNDKLYRVRVIGAASRRRGDEGLRPPRRLGTTAKRAAIASGNDVVSPMHGVVVELKVREGDAVAEGQVVAVIEAMKMMNEIRAHKSGAAAKLHAAVGATVEAGSPLVSLA
ncbi:MAG: ATP-grasp domain-containing protein, partial [Candidatus Eremiobacteraeota bacterium]|nr:ATP-grasp domain-containing protein [Candidatus Eremiobacteraeota bacterium]